MAETVKVGDTVRVTYEGKVSYVDTLQRYVNVDGGDDLRIANAKVEVLKRRAFPVGSVVNVSPGGNRPHVAVKTSGGDWFWAGDNLHSTVLSDEFVAERVARGAHEIVYEPPTA